MNLVFKPLSCRKIIQSSLEDQLITYWSPLLWILLRRVGMFLGNITLITFKLWSPFPHH